MKEDCRHWTLEMHHNLSGGVIRDVDPQAPCWAERLDAPVKPIKSEALILASRHIVGPAVVGDVPVEWRVGKDKIDFPGIRECGEDIPAVSDIEPGVRIIRPMRRFHRIPM